jgi:uncharacterized protein (DUF433 family)
MATATKLVYPHIVKQAGYCGGKAAIDNTRIRVNNLAWLAKQGNTPQQILEHYPDLTLAQVHAALGYYYDNRDEIEAELAREDEDEANFEQRKAEVLAERGRRSPR